MILYFAPGACSLASHIALNEGGLIADRIRVDLKTHRTEDGRDYMTINPKGYVPALLLENGEVLTENIAILSWIADQSLALAPRDIMDRYRLLEMLAFISTEVHKAFKPLFTPDATENEKKRAGAVILKRLTYLAERLKHEFILGAKFSVADAYLFVMLFWTCKNGLVAPAPLPAYLDRMQQRPATHRALESENLIPMRPTAKAS